MKYVNKEYGFEGRPPYFNDFYEEKYKGTSISLENFPKKYILGAGLQAGIPNGALLVGKLGTMWGVRVSYQKNNKWFDCADFLDDVGRLYVSQVGGKFSYFSHGDMTATFVNYDDSSIVLSLSAVTRTSLRVIFYPVKPCQANFKATEKGIVGIAPAFAVIKGKTGIGEDSCIVKGRYDVVFGEEEKKKEYFSANVYNLPSSVKKGKNEEIVYEFDLRNTDSTRVLVFARVGDKSILNMNIPELEELASGISSAEIGFSNANAHGFGALGMGIGNLMNSSMWHRIYNPYFLGCAFFPTRKVNEYYSFKGEELNQSAIIGAHIADLSSASNALEYSYQDKLLGTLTAWIIFCRNRDKNWLLPIYTKLKKEIHPNGDLVVSNWKNKKEVAYKMPNSPLKESLREENMYSLDMSCIKLLNLDILSRMAVICGDLDNEVQYSKAKEELKFEINEVLFNPDLGIYMNRFTGGDFSEVVGATSFYPLIAGAVDSTDKLDRILRFLSENKKFGGEYGVPTLIKEHPEYGVKYKDLKNGTVCMPYTNYRGEIIPYINYLIYLGLVRYGVSDIASDLAQKSVKLYLKHCKKGKYEIYDRYLPNGDVSNQAIRNHISGNFLPVCGLCELIDVEYFRADNRPAIRFGTLLKGEHGASNIPLFGRNFTVTVQEKQTFLLVDDQERFVAEGGRVEIRNFVETNNGCEMIINATENLLITLHLPILYKSERINKIVFAVEKGRSKIKIEGETVHSSKIGV